jgi:hypothetical protein
MSLLPPDWASACGGAEAIFAPGAASNNGRVLWYSRGGWAGEVVRGGPGGGGSELQVPAAGHTPARPATYKPALQGLLYPPPPLFVRALGALRNAGLPGRARMWVVGRYLIAAQVAQ